MDLQGRSLLAVTDLAFEVAAHDEGAHVSYLGPGEIDQAENRMHTIKALMVATLGRKG